MIDKIDTQPENTKETAEDRELQRIDDVYNKVNTKSSKIYYLSLVLFNIVTLIFAFLVLDKIQGVQQLSLVFDSFDYKYILLIMACVIVLLALKSLTMFLKFYNKTRNRNFACVYGAVVVHEYYKRVTLCSFGKNPMSVKYLIGKYKKHNVAIDNVVGSCFFEDIALCIYGFAVLILGLLLWGDFANVILVILSSIILICKFSKILLVLIFNKNKKCVIDFVAWGVKILYKLKLVKDYANTYNKIIDRLIICVKELRGNKFLNLIDVFCNLFSFFLKGAMIYLALCLLNYADPTLFVPMLFASVCMELLLRFYPIKYGTLIFEFLFVVLFGKCFMEGYVFYGLLLFKLFDYFGYVIIYYIQSLIEIVVGKIKTKKQIN